MFEEDEIMGHGHTEQHGTAFHRSSTVTPPSASAQPVQPQRLPAGSAAAHPAQGTQPGAYACAAVSCPQPCRGGQHHLQQPSHAQHTQQQVPRAHQCRTQIGQGSTRESAHAHQQAPWAPAPALHAASAGNGRHSAGSAPSAGHHAGATDACAPEQVHHWQPGHHLSGPNQHGATAAASEQPAAQARPPASAAQALATACQQWLAYDLRRLREHAQAVAAEQLAGLSEAHLAQQLQASVICVLEDACTQAAESSLVPWLGDEEFSIMPVGLSFVVWCASGFALWHHAHDGGPALKDDPDAPEHVVAEVKAVGGHWGGLDAGAGSVLARHLGGMDVSAALGSVRDAYMACILSS